MRQQLHWKDLPGNKYRASLQPEMLSKEGIVKTQALKSFPYIEGQKKEERDVLYDAEYVKAKILVDTVKHLRGMSFVDFQKLIIEVWNSVPEGQALKS